MINFLGIGAQKSGTSWTYACLYEHPEICAPIKELHFFSRPRFEKGKEWYESHFKKCASKNKIGEFSTSYLYSKEAPARIKELYPDVKLIAILRNPVDRAFSQYRNAIKAGQLEEGISFRDFYKHDESVIGQGLYAEQLDRYLAHFKREQMLICIYEDIARNPQTFISSVYTFLGIDADFIPSLLHQKINVARTPKHTTVDSVMHKVAEFLRRNGLDKFVWYVKKSGATDFIRGVNTKTDSERQLTDADRAVLQQAFRDDTQKVSAFLNRDLVSEWGLA